jgi:TRAP-type C4-dicarboxylate transport system permease large subunit
VVFGKCFLIEGFDGICFGVIFTKLSEVGVLTPPVGLNLFVVAAAAGKGTTVADVIKGVGPFLIMEAFVLAILILFPGISLYLPSRMYR